MSDPLDGLLSGVIAVPAYETYILALPEQPDLLHLDAPVRRAVSKAIRSGVEVRQAENEHDLRAWYRLYVRTMSKLILLPKPYRLFELAWKQLRPLGLLRLLLAEHVEAGHRRLLAGFLYLQWGKAICMTTVGWLQEAQALRPNDVLHWRAIQDASAGGFRWYDFGGVELGDQGLARYKRKWGAEAKMVYNYSFPTSSVRTNSTHGRAMNPVRQLAHVTWQHLPIKAIWLLSDWSHAIHYY
jgi:lipid II:glycine glycyltransferase (peptidoglycan interpeptide bridge formation enzyme)